jgi:hypothetical protein
MLGYHEAREALRLSKHHIDDACEQQSYIFWQITQNYTEAVSERDALKENIALVDATLDKDIRAEAKKDGAKITEAQISSEITLHEKHRQIYNDYLDKCKEVSEWGALKEAFIQRANMIRILSDLYVSNYYTVDCTSRNTEQSKTDSIRRQMRNKHD